MAIGHTGARGLRPNVQLVRKSPPPSPAKGLEEGLKERMVGRRIESVNVTPNALILLLDNGFEFKMEWPDGVAEYAEGS